MAAAPQVQFCDPLLSRDPNREEDDDDQAFTERHRYDLERADLIVDADAIVDALAEERWNLQTGQLNPRYELCQGRQSYVVHWAQLFGQDEEGTRLIDAEGLLSFRREGSFEYLFADRPYRGTWTLDGAEMVLEAPWLEGGAPVRSPVEFVRTPVEITFADGRTDTYVEEHYRLGWFRLLRIATTQQGAIRKCGCGEP